MPHAVSYSKWSYVQAYIKTHYPECFYSALLTKNGDNQDKVGDLISECKRKGIKILPPSINEFGDSFIPTRDGIVYKIDALKGLGESALKELTKLKPIKSLDDLLARKNSKVNKGHIITLIKAGCFDKEGDRRELIWNYLMSLRKPMQVKADLQIEMPVQTNSEMEYETLGFYLSEHPLDKYAVKQLSTFPTDEVITIGYVSNMRIFLDKKGNEMAFIKACNQIENVKCIAFSRTWKQIKNDMHESGIYLFKGKRSGSDLLINTIQYLEEL